MADAAWVDGTNAVHVRSWTSTINSSSADTALLGTGDGLRLDAKETMITVNVGASETIQIQGSIKPGAVAADLQILLGASAITADFDDSLNPGGIAALKFTGAVTNATVVTVTQVF